MFKKKRLQKNGLLKDHRNLDLSSRKVKYKFIERGKATENYQKKLYNSAENNLPFLPYQSNSMWLNGNKFKDDTYYDLYKAVAQGENVTCKNKGKHNQSKELRLTEIDEMRTFPSFEQKATDSDTFFKKFVNISKGKDERIVAPLKSMVRLYWPYLGNLIVHLPFNDVSSSLNSPIVLPRPITTSENLNSIFVTKSIIPNALVPFSKLQNEVFAILNNYMDLYYPYKSFFQDEEMRYTYVMHALNHILKSQKLIAKHSLELKKKCLDDSFRDQGLVRPKVLFLVPFRNAALSIVHIMADLLYGKQADLCKKNGTIINYDRFYNDYTGNEVFSSGDDRKPKDYKQIFTGNIDDNFRIGISVSKKKMAIYSEFYSSDVIIASPLGLRLVNKAEDNKRSYDFLNSIELLVIDQAEILFAQNWENVHYVLKHMHLKPESLRNANLNRVRLWNINGRSRYYCQSVLLSAFDLPEFRSIFNNHFHNHFGKIRISKILRCGSINNVILPTSLMFRRLNVNDHESVFEARFNFFVKEILPHFKQLNFAHCMVYVPSYLDFVRLRNFFKAESIKFVQICEYTKKPKIARARDVFFHSGAPFLLYSERSHIFRRTRIKGIRHLIMYQPPSWPSLFSEMVNLMQDTYQNRNDGLETSMSITIIYSKYDLLPLKYILGSERSSMLINSEKTLNVITAE